MRVFFLLLGMTLVAADFRHYYKNTMAMNREIEKELRLPKEKLVNLINSHIPGLKTLRQVYITKKLALENNDNEWFKFLNYWQSELRDDFRDRYDLFLVAKTVC
jgi:uncharacterized protein Usg